jgi:hypothetical protein
MAPPGFGGETVGKSRVSNALVLENLLQGSEPGKYDHFAAFLNIVAIILVAEDHPCPLR